MAEKKSYGRSRAGVELTDEVLKRMAAGLGRGVYGIGRRSQPLSKRFLRRDERLA